MEAYQLHNEVGGVVGEGQLRPSAVPYSSFVSLSVYRRKRGDALAMQTTYTSGDRKRMRTGARAGAILS